MKHVKKCGKKKNGCEINFRRSLKKIKNTIDSIEKSIDNSPILNPKKDIPTNDLENKKTNDKNKNTKIDKIFKILGFNNLFIIF